MKKILLVMFALAVSTASTFAIDPAQKTVFVSLNNYKVFDRVTDYLKTDLDQTDYLKDIFYMTEQKMDKASKNNDNEAFEKAVYFNLANARAVLSRAQYKKYLQLLNTTISYNYNNSSNLLAENNK